VYQACVEAFCYTPDYLPEETTVISLGTGGIVRYSDPHLITSWIGWVLDAMLHSPMAQQTELVARHYPAAHLYRLEPELPKEIGMDEVGRIGELDEIGSRFAGSVDWTAILEGYGQSFRVPPAKCAGARG
jgi:hypothetical protein